jgi:hypothetical protein
MRKIFECSSVETNTRVCREEERKQICFEHPEYDIVCDVIAIEKCVFKGVVGGKRCDYLFIIDKE